MFNFVLGRLSLVEGNPSQAIIQLEEAERCFSEDGRKMESDANRIWLAAAHHQIKNDSVARQIMGNISGGRGQVAHGILVAVHQAREWLDGLQRDAEVGRMVGDLLTRASHMAEKMPAIRRHLHRIGTCRADTQSPLNYPCIWKSLHQCRRQTAQPFRLANPICP